MDQLVAEYTNVGPEAGGTNYLTADHLGTPRVITKADATVKSRHDYLPFGEELFEALGVRTLPQGYASDTVRQKFTQYERDAESGLDYARARYYASGGGRFTSPDPFMGSARLGSPQSWNRYSYVLNNPLAYTDPLGLYPVACGTAEDKGQCQQEQDQKNLNPLIVPQTEFIDVVVININLDKASGRYLSEGEAAARSIRNFLNTSLADEFDNNVSGDNDSAMSGILSVASSAASVGQYSTYRPGMYWRGINGVRYASMSGKGPNQYTGPRSLAIEKAAALSRLAKVAGSAGYILSGIQTVQSYRRGDNDAATKHGVDALMGVLATHGGVPGAVAGGTYFVVDLTGGFEPVPGGLPAGELHTNPGLRGKPWW